MDLSSPCYLTRSTSLSVGVSTTTTGLPRLGPSGAVDTVALTAAAYRERVVGAVVVAGAPAGITAGATTAAGATAAVSSLAAAAAVGAPAGIAAGTDAGHPSADLLFLVAGASAPVGPVVGTARPLDPAVAVGAPVGTAAGAVGPWATAAFISIPVGTTVGAPVWPSFDPPIGGAPYWSTSHAFFTAPQYDFPVQPA
jgi:hypothetical protein